MLANEFIRLPYQFVGWRAPGVPRWGHAHKEFMRQWYRRTIRVMGPVQEMPVFERASRSIPKSRTTGESLWFDYLDIVIPTTR
jgi:hypothetical protein